MKKITKLLFLIFISFVTTNCKGNSNSSDKSATINCDSLTREISQINNSSSFLQFLINHAATYEDFDSIYSIIEDKPCPKNFTYDLVNGDSSKSVLVNKAFLYLVFKNFYYRFDRDYSKTKVESYKDFMPIFSKDDPYNNLFNSYKIISTDIKDRIQFSIDSIKVDSYYFYKIANQDIIVKNNHQSWIKQIDFNRKTVESIYSILDYNLSVDKFTQSDTNLIYINTHLICYTINQNCIFENNFWHKIYTQDEDYLVNDMGGSIIAHNISDFISGSVFEDIIFININNRFIWINFFDWY